MPMAYRIRGEGTAELEIEIFDYIDAWWGITAKDVQEELKKNTAASLIRLRVNSGGGDVFEGLAIYNLLAQHKARVEATVVGLAASIASVIVMAANKIIIAQNAMLMIHNAWGRAVGSKDDMAAMGDLLDKIDGQIADLYVSRTKLAREDVVAMMAAETWMTGQEAKDKGFADEIILNKEPEQQPDAKALARLDLAGFSHVPPVFAQAVKTAREDLARARSVAMRPHVLAALAAGNNPDSTGAARTGDDSKPPRAVATTTPQQEKVMTLAELKEKFPTVYDQIVALGMQQGVEKGIKDERERVNAHIDACEMSGDTKLAFEAIRNGTGLTPALQMRHMRASMGRQDVQNRQDDSEAAGRVVDGAGKTPETGPKDAVDQAAATLWPKKKAS